MTRPVDAVEYDQRAAERAAQARLPRRSGERETAVAEKVDKVLRALPGCYTINTHGDASSHGGTPDRLGVLRGRALAIEIKRPGERPTKRQLVELRRWQAAGALAGWVESERHVHELLDHLDDPQWANPLTGPGDPTVGEPHVGSDTATASGGS